VLGLILSTSATASASGAALLLDWTSFSAEVSIVGSETMSCSSMMSKVMNCSSLISRSVVIASV
jgi:hypothetical protein